MFAGTKNTDLIENICKSWNLDFSWITSEYKKNLFNEMICYYLIGSDTYDVTRVLTYYYDDSDLTFASIFKIKWDKYEYYCCIMSHAIDEDSLQKINIHDMVKYIDETIIIKKTIDEITNKLAIK
jgi:hypothetical protein